MTLDVRKGYFWACWDKADDTVVHTLCANGQTQAWHGVRFQPDPIVFSFGSLGDIAKWLVTTRNNHLHLSRAEGWTIKWEAYRLKGPVILWVVVVWWERFESSVLRPLNDPLNEDFIGPLPGLDVAFLEYVRQFEEYIA